MVNIDLSTISKYIIYRIVAQHRSMLLNCFWIYLQFLTQIFSVLVGYCTCERYYTEPGSTCERYYPHSKVLSNGTSLRHQNTGLVSSGASLTSWGKGASLALVGHPSSDGATIKMAYGRDVLHQPVSHPIFSYWVG